MELRSLFSPPCIKPFWTPLSFHHEASFSLWFRCLCSLQRFLPHCSRRCQRHDDVISRPGVPVNESSTCCFAVVWRTAVHAVLVEEDGIAGLAFNWHHPNRLSVVLSW